jgi:hypothetical protein
MDPDKTPDENWNREQMTRDTDAADDATHEDAPAEVWNRHQLETDDTDPDEPEAVVRTDTDIEPNAGGLSGHGHGSGESHWQRTEYDETKR